MRPHSPLQWPDGWARTAPADRQLSRFQVTLHEAAMDLLDELDRMNASNVAITSDLPTRSDGIPYASGRADDPGIAVWCVVGGAERVFACDRWHTHAGNLRAIGMTVQALRGLSRWGASDMVTRALGGFAALPAGPDTDKAWSHATPDEILRDVAQLTWPVVLRITPVEMVMLKIAKVDPRARAHVLEVARANHREMMRSTKANHRAAMKTAHPDVGGTNERAAALNIAMQKAEEDLNAALRNAEAELGQKQAE